VKNLSDVAAIRSYQDAVLESFMHDSAERHPALTASRPAHLIARLAELSRVSVIARDILAAYQAGERTMPQHSLLHELLKGDGELH